MNNFFIGGVLGFAAAYVLYAQKPTTNTEQKDCTCQDKKPCTCEDKVEMPCQQIQGLRPAFV